ncbi:MAG: serine hydrolase domain-containing protein [Candidatus Promineifilaceae bacterium]
MQPSTKRVTLGLGAAVGGTLLAKTLGWRLKRLWRVMHLFDEDQIVENFLNMAQSFDISTVRKSADPYHFNEGERIALPAHFSFNGKEYNSAEWMQHTGTNGLLILKNDQIVYENYFQGHNADTPHISWSVAKSFVSALFGIALERHLVRSIEETVTDYLPELVGTGYDNVRIKDVLQMSSGVGFDEDYGTFGSDINRFGRVIAIGGSFAAFAASLKNERQPGTYLHYVSIDTQVLAMILMRATGRSVTELLEQWLWQPLGMEHDAYWIVDRKGVEMALGGLNATLRDYAKFGRLYLHNGNWNGKQIVPAAWVQASITPDAPHLQPGENHLSDTDRGYGLQWWIPDNADGEFMAIGIYNQFIYVSLKDDLVIVKQSANHHFTDPDALSSDESVAFFRAIAASLAD